MIVTAQRSFASGRRNGSPAAPFAAMLQDFYRNLLDQGVPEELASLVHQLSDERTPLGEDDRRIALIVEADDEERALAAALLEETDLAVTECRSAEAALMLLREHGGRVAFILVDEALAGPRDGTDLARSTATLWPHVHIVLTTSDPGRTADMPEGVRALRKPWRGLDVLIEAGRAAKGS